MKASAQLTPLEQLTHLTVTEVTVLLANDNDISLLGRVPGNLAASYHHLWIIELNIIVLKSTCQISHLSVAGDQGVTSEAVHAAADGAVVPHLAGIRL